MKTNLIKIDKLVFGGQGLGHVDGKACFVWNALPGETVEMEPVRKRKDIIEAVATNIVQASPDRTAAKEAHFLSCSPWQILTPEQETYWKQQLALETYQHIGKLDIKQIELVDDASNYYGYRNKMEFSFAELTDGTITLALFERGKKVRTSIPGCILASANINTCAQTILIWINQQHIPIRSLKTLIIRSNQAGEVLAALFIKDRLTFDNLPIITKPLTGLYIYYSTHKSPASVPTELLYQIGDTALTETLNDYKLQYGVFSFFQVNLPIFTQALKTISEYLEPNTPLLDYYCGVGAISIALVKHCASAILVDNNAEAISFAQKNIEHNKLHNYTAQCLPAEQLLDVITSTHIMIVDPPRAGLHTKLIETILTKKPQRLIYLSCNLATQARDINLLDSGYSVKSLKLFNFFPRTPHIEGLCILETR
ncbi:MAG: 23S rRNA (uracil(1939)-C(5))-methyltransferase RlmD [Patescibacteria group bacterium]|jgi:23S rRNA (uracil1939-C5)-methyltransferase